MPSSSPTRWLPAAATLLSLAACYGAILAVAALGGLGVALSVHEAAWATAIVAFALLALLGLGLGFRRHRNPWPVVLGALGVAVIAFAMFVAYTRATEIAGFVLLAAGVLADRRLAPRESDRCPEERT